MFFLPLIQEELVSYWQNNGHLILVNCFQEAFFVTLWLSYDRLNTTSSVYHGHKVSNQQNKNRFSQSVVLIL